MSKPTMSKKRRLFMKRTPNGIVHSYVEGTEVLSELKKFEGGIVLSTNKISFINLPTTEGWKLICFLPPDYALYFHLIKDTL